MKLSAALQYENQLRSEADRNKIYLNHDGKFFHAYEWSAWLIKTVACTEQFQQQRGDPKILQAMLYTTKQSQYIITGFPIDSISKYIPQYVSATPVEDGGGDMIIEIALPQDLAEMMPEQMSEAFQQWRTQQPVKEPAGKGKPQTYADHKAERQGGLFSIMSQVLAWPTESKTPMENAAFIADLKAQLIALL